MAARSLQLAAFQSAVGLTNILFKGAHWYCGFPRPK